MVVLRLPVLVILKSTTLTSHRFTVTRRSSQIRPSSFYNLLTKSPPVSRALRVPISKSGACLVVLVANHLVI